jgi:ribosome biogenesis GTPase
MNLSDLGWNSFFDKHFEQYKSRGLSALRVIQEHKEKYVVRDENTELAAEVSGKFRFNALSRSDFPAVGDWVAANKLSGENKAIIQALLPRKSNFSRKAVLAGGMPDTGGKTDQQVLAANIDTVFLVSGLDTDFNIRRIERYLATTWESGARPVVVLNKSDLCPDIDSKITEVESVALDVPIIAISAANNIGFEVINGYLKPGHTIALLGSSGVGKSTIINCLLGENRLKTRAVREYDNRGRHTTTHRELIVLPGGGIVIDTPGMREIQVWGDDRGLRQTFEDIEQLANLCQFSDCKHETEPGCAIKQALEDGSLDQKRYTNYIRLLKEQQSLALRKNQKEYRSHTRARDKKYRNINKEREKLRKKGLI